MKKWGRVIMIAVMMACCAAAALGQSNPRGTSKLMIKGKAVSVDYGRPSLKGRTTDDLLGRLKPGGMWRLGADTSTTFKTDVDLAFGDVEIPAGEYSIWMQREADNSWKLLFDKKHGQWGEPAPDPADCFASVPLTVSTPGSPVDMVTLTLAKASDGGTLTIQWGTLEAAAKFKAN